MSMRPAQKIKSSTDIHPEICGLNEIKSIPLYIEKKCDIQKQIKQSLFNT